MEKSFITPRPDGNPENRFSLNRTHMQSITVIIAEKNTKGLPFIKAIIYF